MVLINKMINKKINSNYLRLISGSLWSIIGAIIYRGSSLLATIIVARIIGKIAFGELGIIQSTVGTVGTLAGLGLGMTSTKYIANLRSNNKDQASRILGLTSIIGYSTAIISTLLVIIFRNFIAAYLLNAPQLGSMLLIGSFLVFFGVINGIQTAALAGFEAFKTITYLNLITGIISLPTILLLTNQFGLSGTLYGMVITSFVNWFANFYSIQKECKKNNMKVNIKNCWEEKSIILNFTLPAALSGIIPTIWIANIFLVNQPNGYEEMAYLSIANSWQTLVMFLPVSIGPVLLSLLSTFISENKKEYWKIVKLSIFINLLITGLATVMVLVLSDFILSFYGKDYRQAKFLLVLMIFVTVFKSINNVVGQVIATASTMWRGFFLNFFWAIIFIVSSYVLVGKFEALGIAYSHLISYILLLMISLYYLKQIRKSTS
jgi:O-antigen/teichoic acid export membrane protein